MVLGSGPSALLAIQVMQRFQGAENVVVIDRNPSRLQISSKIGAQEVFDSSLQMEELSAIVHATSDSFADYVFDALPHVEDGDGDDIRRIGMRLLRPGGVLVLDALAAGRLSVLINVHLLERLPGGPPRGLHDPALFVDREQLVVTADRLGLDLELVGLRPSMREAIAWKFGRRRMVRMKQIRSTAVVFAGYGRKR